MAETTEQYVRRLLGYVQDRDPLEILEETPAHLADVLAGHSDDRLRQCAAPGKWSICEILAHLADGDLVVGYRVRLILGQNGVPIQSYDQDRWAAFSHYNDVHPSESLHRLRVQRLATLRLLRSLSPEQWEQYGVHSERGRETVAHVTRMWAGHDLNHRMQIERILREDVAKAYGT